MTKTSAPPTPQKIMQLQWGFIPSAALKAALDLDLFTHIQAGKKEAGALAAAAGVTERGVRPLLYTLASLGLLEHASDQFSLTPEAEMFLLPSSPAYLGVIVQHQVAQLAAWTQLGDAIRTGTTPMPAVEGDEDDGSFFADFVGGLFNLNHPSAKATAAHIQTASTALDVGCGSGVWSLALAERFPQLRVTALDRATVLGRVTRKFLERFGCADRYELRAGNFRDVEIETAHYDVAILGHILHSEGEDASRQLLRRLASALRPGGVLVVAEMVGSDPRPENTFSNLFDLNMLMWTRDGRVFSKSELEKMVKEVELRPEWVEVPGPFPVLLAHRT